MFYSSSPGPITWHIEGVGSLSSNEERRIVGLFSFACLSTYDLTQVMEWLSSLGHFYSLPENYPDIFDKVASYLWTFQPSWYQDPIDCSDSMLGILALGAIGDIKEPQKGKIAPFFSVLYLNPALEHVAYHSLPLTLPPVPNIQFMSFSIGPNSQAQQTRKSSNEELFPAE